VAFLNDSTDERLAPTHHQTGEFFQDLAAWFYPDVPAIMNSDQTSTKVLCVLYTNTMTVISTKIIPIQLFLVPLLLNGRETLNAIGTFQLF